MDQDRYFILNKPYDMVSQFVSTHDVPLLGDVVFDFPEGTHAIGRLDKNSEGMLLLTTNKKITRLLFQSVVPHTRTYLIQVRGIVTESTVEALKQGVTIPVKGGVDYVTKPCDVTLVEKPHNLFSSGYELHERVPSSWLHITLTEGKFHQVRKMVDAVRHPCKRLIRISIEDIHLEDLLPGEVKEIGEDDFFRKLRL
jgi:23S rRNA pseudouridine2457 synthase